MGSTQVHPVIIYRPTHTQNVLFRVTQTDSVKKMIAINYTDEDFKRCATASDTVSVPKKKYLTLPWFFKINHLNQMAIFFAVVKEERTDH